MPTYCYRTKDGNIHDVVMTIEEKALRQDEDGQIVLDDGRKAKMDVASQVRGQGTHGSDNWPIHSIAAGVMPRQIAEATEHARARGVPTDFDAKGRVIFTSPSHRRKYLKTRGFHDEDGYD